MTVNTARLRKRTGGHRNTATPSTRPRSRPDLRRSGSVGLCPIPSVRIDAMGGGYTLPQGPTLGTCSSIETLALTPQTTTSTGDHHG